MPARRYPLRPRWGVMVAAILFFGGCAAVFVHLANANTHGLIIYGWELDAQQARTAYVVLAGLSFMLVAMGVVGTVRLAVGGLQVIVDDKLITIPRTFRPPVILAYSVIRDAYLQAVQGQEFLTVVGPVSKVSVARAHLADADFAELLDVLAERVPSVRLERSEPRRERPFAKPPLPGPARIDGDPFRAPPTAHLRPIETAAPAAPAPLVADAAAPDPKLLR